MTRMTVGMAVEYNNLPIVPAGAFFLDSRKLWYVSVRSLAAKDCALKTVTRQEGSDAQSAQRYTVSFSYTM